MSIEQIVRVALEEIAEGPQRPVDVAALVARGERVRRRRMSTGVVALAAATVLGAGVVITRADPLLDLGPVRPPTTGPVTPPTTAGVAWGPGVPYSSIGGLFGFRTPYADGEPWPHIDRIESFTVVETGIVYVNPDNTTVVWEGWQHETKVIGQYPWNPGDRPESLTFGEHRDLIGSPSEDVVAWVEPDGQEPGDLVVVQASTGEELARTPVSVHPGFRVVLAAVDAEAVYYAPIPSDVPVLGSDVWVWRWAAGETPRTSHLDEQTTVLDVAGGVWAVDRGDGRLRFEDESGRLLSDVDAGHEDRTTFGLGLSPDGRFWYAPTYSVVIVTATGEQVTTAEMTERFGWFSDTQLGVVDKDGLQVCDAVTGRCEATGVPRPPAQWPRYGLPLN